MGSHTSHSPAWSKGGAGRGRAEGRGVHWGGWLGWVAPPDSDQEDCPRSARPLAGTADVYRYGATPLAGASHSARLGASLCALGPVLSPPRAAGRPGHSPVPIPTRTLAAHCTSALSTLFWVPASKADQAGFKLRLHRYISGCPEATGPGYREHGCNRGCEFPRWHKARVTDPRRQLGS